jgi:hypothetical protein
MAEALLAFGVAANIVQFIDFTAKVICVGYHTGASRYGGLNGIDLVRNVNDDFRIMVDRLEKSLKMEQRNNNPTENQKELLNLAEQCRDVAAELFVALESLKLRARERSEAKTAGRKAKTERWQGWENFRTALKIVWKEDEIKLLEEKVDAFRQQLVVRILVSLRYVIEDCFSIACFTKILK